MSDLAAAERERCLAILRAYEDMFAKRGRSIVHDAAACRGMADAMFEIAELIKAGANPGAVRSNLKKRNPVA